MTSSKYELTAIVESEALSDVLPHVKLLRLEEIEEQEKEPKVDKKIRTKTSKYRKASRYKGSLTGEELITKLMSDGRIHGASEITKVFQEQGFGHNSSSPLITNMVAAGAIMHAGKSGNHDFCEQDVAGAVGLMILTLYRQGGVLNPDGGRESIKELTKNLAKNVSDVLLKVLPKHKLNLL